MDEDAKLKKPLAEGIIDNSVLKDLKINGDARRQAEAVPYSRDLGSTKRVTGSSRAEMRDG